MKIKEIIGLVNFVIYKVTQTDVHFNTPYIWIRLRCNETDFTEMFPEFMKIKTRLQFSCTGWAKKRGHRLMNIILSNSNGFKKRLEDSWVNLQLAEY